jgi:hypothetical protein
MRWLENFTSAFVYSVVDLFFSESKDDVIKKNAAAFFVGKQLKQLSTQLRIPVFVLCFLFEFGTFFFTLHRFSKLYRERRLHLIKSLNRLRLPVVSDFLRLLFSLSVLAFGSAESLLIYSDSWLMGCANVE